MRSLNGQDYTLLFIAKPVPQANISRSISDLISIRDNAFAVSKRNIGRTYSISDTTSKTNSATDNTNSTELVGKLSSLGEKYVPIVGRYVGGAFGNFIGTVIGQGKSHSDSYSDSISKAIMKSETISGDIQNGFALELMQYTDSAIERLKGGQNNGMWQTAITYSADNKIAVDIIRACLSGELSKLDSEKLPMLAFEPSSSTGETLLLPNFLEESALNPMCSCINSAELGLLCTVPVDSVPDFELRLEKKFPLIASRVDDSGIRIGNVVDGRRPLENMPFDLSEQDLNRHTFVCGITGSGKTTTVKKILAEAKKPFLVIESAKKEYRNINTKDKVDVYTPGKTEINAPQINPFYIMPGVSPQAHIDFLKDLFNASFSFYGPMPYILEKCLHTVYRNKGWNLTLGYHPLLVNTKNPTDFFDIGYMKDRYANTSHKFIFPTMQELKDEIARYIEEDLKYDGEVAGNVKTAMKVRLENLCVGAKGFTFNTSEFLDFDSLLKRKVVFELEGLADDSDKAFCVGLLVIFINEYRQVHKEILGNQKTGLQHLLVIEEAHRLLKNVETERSTETIGNPKGKAVEHFSNMIAEMRSYGQGVIVAEQIPTKIAPDVIKNSSTKIVQRIVSLDDQQVMANTIGITSKDAIQLGSLETGFAYCHKEGMALPTLVKVNDSYNNNGLDVFISDDQLYNSDSDRFEKLNLSIVRDYFGGNNQIKLKIIGLINTMMIERENLCVAACNKLREFISDEIKKNDVTLVFSDSRQTDRIVAQYLTEVTLTMMAHGVYCTKALPDNELAQRDLPSIFYYPTNEKISSIKKKMQKLYSNSLDKYAKRSIAALVKRSMKENTDVLETIRKYFAEVSNNTVNEIFQMIKGAR